MELKREAERLREKLDESRKAEAARLLEDTEQQWESLLQTCQEAQTRSLADDFQAQSRNVQSWLRERERQLQSAGIHSPPEDRRRLAQVGCPLCSYFFLNRRVMNAATSDAR